MILSIKILCTDKQNDEKRKIIARARRIGKISRTQGGEIKVLKLNLLLISRNKSFRMRHTANRANKDASSDG